MDHAISYLIRRLSYALGFLRGSRTTSRPSSSLYDVDSFPRRCLYPHHLSRGCDRVVQLGFRPPFYAARADVLVQCSSLQIKLPLVHPLNPSVEDSESQLPF